MQEQVKAVDEHNPFTKMGIIKFWAISTIVYLTFPVLLVVSYIACGSLLIKQLITALFQDFLKTLLVTIVVLIVLIWVTVHYLGPTLAAWFGG